MKGVNVDVRKITLDYFEALGLESAPYVGPLGAGFSHAEAMQFAIVAMLAEVLGKAKIIDDRTAPGYRPPVEHGTVDRGFNRACRCQACVDAYDAAMKRGS